MTNYYDDVFSLFLSMYYHVLMNKSTLIRSDGVEITYTCNKTNDEFKIRLKDFKITMHLDYLSKEICNSLLINKDINMERFNNINDKLIERIKKVYNMKQACE